MVMSVFNHRRLFQELKMQGLSAKVLKIDFNYKLAEKIRVWTKPVAASVLTNAL
jgi:hypothetical protein